MCMCVQVLLSMRTLNPLEQKLQILVRHLIEAAREPSTGWTSRGSPLNRCATSYPHPRVFLVYPGSRGLELCPVDFISEE